MAPNSTPSVNMASLSQKLKHHILSDSKIKIPVKKHCTKDKKLSGFTLFKPFGCGQCRMRFIHMDELQKHVRFHNKEKDLISSQSTSTTKDQETDKGGIMCCLPGCNKMFKSRRTLGNHIRRVHPLG